MCQKWLESESNNVKKTYHFKLSAKDDKYAGKIYTVWTTCDTTDVKVSGRRLL
jgi:membrane-bound inhibitor of C-type lysozyme